MLRFDLQEGESMNWSADELLFYGGILCAAGAVLAEILCFCVFLIKKRRLKRPMGQEYGERR